MSGAGKKALWALLLLGVATMLALNLPGQMSYDSVSQIYQGRTGLYNSWHPPVMAWLLGRFDSVWPGSALFVLFDAALLAGAWGLLLSLAQKPGWGAGAVLLLALLTPQFLLYQGAVWKDVLFADAAIAGFAMLAAFAAGQSRLWLIGFALMLVLAALARQNGVLLLPIGAAALGWILARQETHRRARHSFLYAAGMLLLLLLAVVGASLALARHGDDNDGAEAEIRTAQTYDMIGALAASPGLPLPLMDQQDPQLSKLMRGDGMRYYSVRDAGALSRSPALNDAISDAPDGLIFDQWENLVLTRPGLYLAMRWPVFLWVLATPDVAACHPAFAGIEGDAGQLAALGLTPRIRPQDRLLAGYTAKLMGTPVLSHLVFLVLALMLLVALLWRRQGPDIAMAGLLVGALAFTASFFVISLACDYRYLDFLDLAAMTASLHWALSRPDRYKN